MSSATESLQQIFPHVDKKWWPAISAVLVENGRLSQGWVDRTKRMPTHGRILAFTPMQDEVGMFRVCSYMFYRTMHDSTHWQQLIGPNGEGDDNAG